MSDVQAEVEYAPDADTEMCANCGNDFTDHCPECWRCQCSGCP